MAITITLDDDLAASLENQAKKQRVGLEQLALSILTEAMAETESTPTGEVVARIKATSPNPSQVRPATASLAELLNASLGDPGFDLASWNKHWSTVEAESKTVTRANDIAEGRRR